ncbi:response regulator [Pleurocapsa sp. PCC 7319]|uniref:hybrid sensor histidine kinase/response regulator n=1 Tax=Pleurocapsa sp. PCC 7319 TaxID=118161 RepID=UPI00034D0A22|nr:response regulator [Pleurocapsa sp. PCC 7319]
MIIEDEELRELYKTSSREHLQKLESELMILEKNPQDVSSIDEFLREAHTLKGDSRMLGLNDIEMLVHQLEDCVEGIKAGKGEITPELCDRLYQGIDAVNQLSHQAITGDAVEVNTFEVLALLMGASDADESAGGNETDLFEEHSSSEASLFEDDEAAFFDTDSSSEASLFDNEGDDFLGDEHSSEASLFDDEVGDNFLAEKQEPIVDTVDTTNINQPVKTTTPTRDYKIDTIRVEPQKLDTLMTHASELAVTKLRISQQMTEINQMLTLWEGWSHNNLVNNNLWQEIEQSLRPEQIQPLKYFFNITQQRVNSLGGLVNNLKARASEDVTSLGIIADRLESGIQDLRQLPLSTVFNIYPRMVRDLAKQQGKEINLIIEGGDTKADKRILEEIKDPLLHLIRNAVDHGIETPEERISQDKPQQATIILRGYQLGNSIGIEISDDGRGLNLESIKKTAIRRNMSTEAELAVMSSSEIQSLIFASGFSTRTEITELSGRGVGLDVVRANVERLKGSIQVASTPGNGCKFQVRLGTSLAITRVLIVGVSDNFYAIPVEYIANMLAISRSDIYTIKDSEVINFEERPISIVQLGSLLQLPTGNQAQTTRATDKLLCVVLSLDNDFLGLIVDAFVDRQDIVFKPQSKLLKRIPNIAGATILGSGEVCMILNPPDLLHSLRNGSWQDVSLPAKSKATKNKLLLVEDSVIIRTQMQRLLKGAGYDVTLAENGLEGLQKVQEQNFDIVLSDVEMPGMNGFEMTATIRQNSKYNQLPIVLITTLASPEDKRRGKEVGANAYLTKGDFEQQVLFQTLKQLISQG